MHATRTKSMAAAYLMIPSLIGTIFGISLSNDLKETDIRPILRHDYGIKSNTIDNTQWSGVSLSDGWISFQIASVLIVTGALYCIDDLQCCSLAALWEMSDSKRCLLEFLIACDRSIPYQ
jgi:hypothetical protein